MNDNHRKRFVPLGGLQAGPQARRGWRWSRSGALVSAPVRCRREQWYLARARCREPEWRGKLQLVVRFHHADATYTERALALHDADWGRAGEERLGWFQTPEDATHLELRLPAPEVGCVLEEIVFYPVAERDPKCHPLARVPRWSAYRPPFPLERVVLPPSLEALVEVLPEQEVDILRAKTRGRLVGAARRAAVVMTPDWVALAGGTWESLCRLARESWVIVDLETLARLLGAAGWCAAHVVQHEAPHGIMSARVAYSDVPTRGFALQDVFPYGFRSAEGGFSVRVLRAGGGWKRFADRHGFATLLASETPWADRCGDVLSAAMPVGVGELLGTDLPWLAAGCCGPSVAPGLARHALRMHLGAPLADALQYWNRWDDSPILVRDISDLARRFPPLRAVRWASPTGEVAPLGIALPALEGPARGTLLLRTGRIDNLAPHGGLPPEPLIIFMKMLARDWNERTAWARRHLRELTVVWQFDTAAGLRYAANYASAATVLSGRQLQVRLDQGPTEGVGDVVVGRRFLFDEGLFGDRCFDVQRALDGLLRRSIEQAGRGVANVSTRVRKR